MNVREAKNYILQTTLFIALLKLRYFYHILLNFVIRNYTQIIRNETADRLRSQKLKPIAPFPSPTPTPPLTASTPPNVPTPAHPPIFPPVGPTVQTTSTNPEVLIVDS